MAIEEVVPGPFVAGTDLLALVGKIGLWLQAIGIIIIIWLILHIINWIINHKRLKMVYTLKNDVVRIEEKIDRILKTVEKKKN
ncbi:hypothetical protein HYV50_02715 [Candidatus Pacearchaeota archaeon]|nr:hypothetical protein [Candidatus Pacearchaeota archaeon]